MEQEINIGDKEYKSIHTNEFQESPLELQNLCQICKKNTIDHPSCPYCWKSVCNIQNHLLICAKKCCLRCIIDLSEFNNTEFICKTCHMSLCNHHQKTHEHHLFFEVALPIIATEWNPEGIMVNNKVISLREETCKQLLDELNTHGLLLIKSPPYTGKSSLSILFEFYISHSFFGALSYRIELHKIFNNDEFTMKELDELFVQSKIKSTSTDFFLKCQTNSNQTFYLIIDEAQFLYKNCQSFLSSMKASQKSNLKIICFAGYGINSPNTSISTPIEFVASKSVRRLNFSQNEFNEFLKNYNESKFGIVAPINGKIAECIKDMTGGHTGLLKRALDTIYIKFAKELNFSDEDIYNYILSRAFIQELSNSRALPKNLQSINENSKKIINTVLIADKIIIKSNENLEDYHRLVLSGLLSTYDGTTYEFSSPFIRKMYLEYYVRAAYSSQISLRNLSLEHFIYRFLSYMRRNFLFKTSIFKKGRPILERLWQHEVYCAISHIIGKMISLNVEVPPFDCQFTKKQNYLSENKIEDVNELSFEQQIFMDIFNNDDLQKIMDFDASESPIEVVHKTAYEGFLDFFINGNYRWGLELTREGDGIETHLNRFLLPDGQYSKMNIKDYMLIDFRKCKPMDKYLENNHYMAVQYEKDFKFLLAYYKNKIQEIPLIVSE